AAAGLLTAGLVGTAGTASAAKADDPYVGSQPTDPEVKVPNVITPGKPVRFKISIATLGNAKAKGKLTFVVRKPNGKKVKTITRKYSKAGNFGIGKLPRGKYKVVIKFKTNKNSVFK